MAHDYNVPLTVLSITPTRDNDAAPGGRLPDKHSRLFCGKTLDEWTMIQLWSSQSITHKIFVCETYEHMKKLAEPAVKYDVELMVRPASMLHPLNDSGSIVGTWAFKKALEKDWCSLITTPLVVTPCRPPGFFDAMVSFYQQKIGNPDYTRQDALVYAGYASDITSFEIENGKGKQLGQAYLNKNYKLRSTKFSHFVAATWWYEAYLTLQQSRHDVALHPIFYDIEPWMDCHIDTEDEWKEAEFWFREKILSQGEQCYERYRWGWENK